MEKLFKILSRGEMPDFLQVLEALNDVSDINWDRVEHSKLKITDVLRGKSIPNYPAFCPGQFCDVCG